MTDRPGQRGAPPWSAAAAPLELPQVIGHRGASAAAPENTLVAFRRARDEGARWIEFDVHLAGDGTAIILHDDEVDRTTDGHGLAGRMTLAELRALDAGKWFAPEFAGERIPTFAETIALLAEGGLSANVEIKPAHGREKPTAEAAIAAIRELWPAHVAPPLVSSFAPESLAVVRDTAPEMRRGHLFGRLPPDWRARAEALGCETIHCAEKGLSGRAVRAVREAGFPLLVYTVNDPARARQLLDQGASAVFTDCPGRILAALASPPRAAVATG